MIHLLLQPFPNGYLKTKNLLQVVTVAKLQGGSAFNVIPDSVTIGGTFRAFSKESLFQLEQRIREVNLSKESDSEVIYCSYFKEQGTDKFYFSGTST